PSFPYTTLFRSCAGHVGIQAVLDGDGEGGGRGGVRDGDGRGRGDQQRRRTGTRVVAIHRCIRRAATSGDERSDEDDPFHGLLLCVLSQTTRSPGEATTTCAMT